MNNLTYQDIELIMHAMILAKVHGEQHTDVLTRILLEDYDALVTKLIKAKVEALCATKAAV